MKASDSTNSLSALNPDVEQGVDSVCFICLEEMHENGEPLVDSSLLRTCGCQFKVHPVCWNAWMKDKTEWDCPICRKKSVNQKRPPVPIFQAVQEWQDQQEFSRKRIYVFIAIVLAIIFSSVLIYKMMNPS